MRCEVVLRSMAVGSVIGLMLGWVLNILIP